MILRIWEQMAARKVLFLHYKKWTVKCLPVKMIFNWRDNYSWKCDWLHWRGKPNKRYIVTNCVNLYGLPVVTASPLSGKCLYRWQNYTTKPYLKWNWLHWQNHREQKGERESGKFSTKEKLLVGHVCVKTSWHCP